VVPTAAGNRRPAQDGLDAARVVQCRVIDRLATAIEQRPLAAATCVPEQQLPLEITEARRGDEIDAGGHRRVRIARKDVTAWKCSAQRGCSSSTMCVRARPVSSSSFIRSGLGPQAYRSRARAPHARAGTVGNLSHFGALAPHLDIAVAHRRGYHCAQVDIDDNKNGCTRRQSRRSPGRRCVGLA